VKRAILLALGLTCSAAGTSSGQAVPARSSDYLFTPSVDDARSLWVNPAGLAAVLETSIMGELVLTLSEESATRLSQWTVGFNARGISVGFQRDRLVSDSANQALRFGFSRPFPGGSLGVSLTNYGSGTNDQGWDAGLRLAPLPTISLGFVVRNIGRPLVRAQVTPITAAGGVTWTGGSAVQASAEALITERIGTSGHDTSFRAGLRLSTRIPLPLAGFAVAESDGQLNVTQWSFGLAVGGYRRGLVVGTLPRGTASGSDLLSLHALATNRGAILMQR
jgi:hypothetical protein